jgi:alkylation response protein AidB-like acyl-CoA dehydrogenase
MSPPAPTTDDGLIEYQARVRTFVETHVAPKAREIDEAESTPPALLATLRASRYLGMALPREWGGGGIDPIAHGLATEEFGRACSSIRSLLTVHNMSSQAISRIGTSEQRKTWLPALCSGDAIIAFALTEKNAGSSADAIQTSARDCGGEYEITGAKKWITYGQIADLFLVFAQFDHRPISVIVERDAPGLSITPMRGLFGTRGSMLAELGFAGVRVPKSHQLGAPGAGINIVANTALDHGRFSVAWGCVGIIQSCLDASLDYASGREQGGQRLKDHQLIRRLLSDMLVSYRAAKEVCLHAARLRRDRDPRGANETALAKYLASTSAIKTATDALHLHGANGCSADFPVARLLRDANVMSIVEGTDEIHQIALANYALQRPYRSFNVTR